LWQIATTVRSHRVHELLAKLDFVDATLHHLMYDAGVERTPDEAPAPASMPAERGTGPASGRRIEKKEEVLPTK
jgi:hypothetical protein